MLGALRRSYNNAVRVLTAGGHVTFSQSVLQENYNRSHSGCSENAKNGRMTKTALVILADGAEEMEFTIAADVLRRAGIAVTVAGINDASPVKCSRGIVIVPDTSLDVAVGQQYDVVVLPGGLGGSNAMCQSSVVGDLLRTQEASGRLIAAICAAPTALAAHGIATGKSLTSYPAMKDKLTENYCYVDDKNVVKDGNLITSRGPGTAFDFALKIAEELAGAAKMQEVAKGMLLTA